MKITEFDNHMDRRALLGALAGTSAGLAGLTAASPARAVHEDDASDSFTFEVTRTDAEWRARLTDEEYDILRRGGTEMPDTSPLASEFDPGRFHCKGCDLTLYLSEWRVDLPYWVFFRHSQPHTTLTEIDTPPAEYGLPEDGPGNMIEVVCRRCGSHLGHIIDTPKGPTHCINGTSLVFRPETA